jgi:hypothetical protein
MTPEQEAQLKRIEEKLDRLLAKSKKGPETNETVMAWAKEQPAYRSVNVAQEWDKMAAFFDGKGKTLSKRRFINWLNGALDRAPLAEPSQNGHRMPTEWVAWLEVKRVIEAGGQGSAKRQPKGPIFSHPRIGAAVEAIGWPELFWADGAKTDILRSQFLKCYRGMGVAE